MASDGIDCRIDGKTNIVGRFFEVTNFRVGYFGIEECTLLDNARYHEELRLVGNELVELSTDNFATCVFKGRIAKINPGGIGREGVQYTARGLDWVLNSQFFTKWNGRSEFSYNDQGMTDLSSPGSFTDVLGKKITDPSLVGTALVTTNSRKARWTVGEMIVDILEHAFGLNTPERVSSYAGGPTVSAIPIHHMVATSVTDPYAHLFPLGSARDYLDQLVWDAADIMDVLNFEVPDVDMREIRLWDALQHLVQMGGEHGLFIDPRNITRPKLEVVRFQNSVTVEVRAGEPGVHVETSDIRVIVDDWEFDLEGMHNTIVIEGRPMLKKTGSLTGDIVVSSTGLPVLFNASLAANHPFSGKLDKLTSDGKVWRIRNQSACFVAPGYFSSNFRDQGPVGAESYGPVLWKNGAKISVESGLDVLPITLPGSGIVVFQRSISGDLRLETLIEMPFKISVGPIAGYSPNRPKIGPGSIPRYPAPGPFDGWAQTGKKTELHVVLESYVHSSRQVDQSIGGVKTQPTNIKGKNDGVLRGLRFTARGLISDGRPGLILNPEDRDDTLFMLLFAEEMQRRMRDIRIKLTLNLDRIDLAGLYEKVTIDPLSGLPVTVDPVTGATVSPSSQPGLRKNVSLIGLRKDRWSDAILQVMSVSVDVTKDSMTLECSNDVFNVNGRFKSLWRQMQRDHQIASIMKKQKNAESSDYSITAGGIGENQTPRLSNTRIREPDRAGISVYTDDEQLTTVATP